MKTLYVAHTSDGIYATTYAENKEEAENDLIKVLQELPILAGSSEHDWAIGIGKNVIERYNLGKARKKLTSQEHFIALGHFPNGIDLPQIGHIPGTEVEYDLEHPDHEPGTRKGWFLIPQTK